MRGVCKEGGVLKGGSFQTQLSIDCLGIVGKEHGTGEVAIKHELRGETVTSGEFRFKAPHKTYILHQYIKILTRVFVCVP